MVPFPYDVVDWWKSRNNVTLSKEAYLELCSIIDFYCDRAGGGNMPLPEFMRDDG